MIKNYLKICNSIVLRMSEQTLNVNVTVQKDKKKNIRKAGKTLLIKPNEGVEIDEIWFNDLVGLVSKSKTAKTGSYFLTFDNVGNSLDSLKTLRKKHEGDILVKFAHYKVFFTITQIQKYCITSYTEINHT